MNTIQNDREYYDETFEKIHLKPGELLRARFTDCTFVKCVFEGVHLRNCRFSGCTFTECNLSLADVSGSAFPETKFENSKLLGINWSVADWSSARFAIPEGFFECVLNHSIFIGLELKGIQIRNCMAHEVDFRNANLSQGSFSGTDLSKSIFYETNLTKADLSGARNYQINPETNTIKKAKFSLPEAMSLLYQMDIVIKE